MFLYATVLKIWGWIRVWVDPQHYSTRKTEPMIMNSTPAIFFLVIVSFNKIADKRNVQMYVIDVSGNTTVYGSCCNTIMFNIALMP